MRITRTVQPKLSVLGIDPSLTSTGYSYRDESEVQTGVLASGKLRGASRLRFVRGGVSRIVEVCKPKLVVYEDYAMGVSRKQSNNMFHTGELGGVLKLELYERGYDVLLVPPSTLKLAIAGKGNADKEAMARAVKEYYGLTITQDDEVDAFCLMAFGEAFLSKLGPKEVVARAHANISKTVFVKGRALL